MKNKRRVKPENLPPTQYDDGADDWSLTRVGVLCGLVLAVFLAGWIGWKTLHVKGLAGVAMFAVIFGLLKLAELSLNRDE